jgi:hypothetical protein
VTSTKEGGVGGSAGSTTTNKGARDVLLSSTTAGIKGEGHAVEVKGIISDGEYVGAQQG